MHWTELFMVMTVIRLGQPDKRFDHYLLGTSMIWPEQYEPRSVIHSRFQMSRGGRVMLSSPRFRPGVPFTLGMFEATAACQTNVEPDVTPFPPQQCAHRTRDTNTDPPPLVNVVDVFLDKHEILWALDVGTINTMTQPERVAPPKIVRLEIDDDVDTYKTYEIELDAEQEETEAEMCLQFIVAHQSPKNTFVFVTDAGRDSLIMFDMYKEMQSTIVLPEKTAYAERDVMFMLLLHKTMQGTRRPGLYFTYLSGCHMYVVQLDNIDQCSAVTARPVVMGLGRKPYRITVLGSDGGSRMFFRRPAENEIWSWDVNTHFHPSMFELVTKGQDCRAPVQVTAGYDHFLFVLKNNFGDYVRNTTGSLGAYTIIQPVSRLPKSPGNSSTTKDTDDDARCDCPG